MVMTTALHQQTTVVVCFGRHLEKKNKDVKLAVCMCVCMSICIICLRTFPLIELW